MQAASPLPTTAVQTVAVEVGSGVKLQPQWGASSNRPPQWTSSAPSLLEVLQNGWILGLEAGQATVQASEGTQTQSWSVRVTRPQPTVRTPASLLLFPDNRRFELEGRLCFGTELNGHVLGVPHKGFLESNRIINPRPLDPRKRLLWEIAPGTEVLDGAGTLMGTVAPTLRKGNQLVPASAFNFGMSKVIRGRLYLYGFGTEITVAPSLRPQLAPADIKDGKVATSAWIPLDGIADKETLLERFGLGRGKLPALPLQREEYRITGGNPGAYLLPEGELAIVKEANGPVPSHYLRRPSGTINVLYSVPGFGLGGQGLDSFLLGDGLTFRPAQGVRPMVQPTYYPLQHPKARQVADKTMTFLYGAVTVPGGEPVFGWVAKEALEALPGAH